MGGSLPLYPNFRLGVLQGSACDNTNSVVEVPYDENKRYNALSVFAISGELIGDYKNKTIQELRSETSLIPGLYFVRISHHGFKTKTFKLIF
ncbi:MAG TPA: T9SS type A sorting domain-containing protein [Saprospiraceae bacterium]|nr:T9SS type A sorting domain-containing protein [Saprospiraceae bacterium]